MHRNSICSKLEQRTERKKELLKHFTRSEKMLWNINTAEEHQFHLDMGIVYRTNGLVQGEAANLYPKAKPGGLTQYWICSVSILHSSARSGSADRGGEQPIHMRHYHIIQPEIVNGIPSLFLCHLLPRTGASQTQWTPGGNAAAVTLITTLQEGREPKIFPTTQ